MVLSSGWQSASQQNITSHYLDFITVISMIYRTPLLAFLTHHQRTRIIINTTTQSTSRLIMSASASTAPLTIFQSIKEAQEHVLSTTSTTSSGTSTGTAFTTPCGELKCQHDSLLSSLSSAHIVSYAPFIEKKTSTKKKKKKSSQNNDNATSTGTGNGGKGRGQQYVIVLSDSVFFPEGGGQPSDCGEIVIESKKIQNKNDEEKTEGTQLQLQVTDAQNVKGTCILTCSNAEDSIEDVISTLSSASSTTTTTIKSSDKEDTNEERTESFQIIQKVNWEKRLEYMTSHSAQHLISAVALGNFGIDTQSFSLRPDSLVSYIDFIWNDSLSSSVSSDGGDNNGNDNDDKSISEEDFKNVFGQIEEKVNDHIQSNLSMSPTWFDPNDEEEESSTHKDKEGLRSRLLPKGLTGKIRLVSIDGVDLNTCCGTHVKNLSQLQMIKFFKVEKFKSNIIRVYFASGRRLMKILQGNYDMNASLMKMLSCTEQETVVRVQNLLEEKRERERDVKDLKEKLCQSQAKEVVEDLKNNNNLAVVDLGYGVDMMTMTMLSTEVANRYSEDDFMLLLVGSPNSESLSTSSSDEGSFLLTGEKDLVDNCGKEVASLFEGRGGGRGGKFQGKGTKIRSALKDVKALLESKKK
jgi:misacylated tRNA(Ala) deacylase